MTERPYFEPIPVHPEYALNPHILKWWEKKHDALLESEIRKMHWLWVWGIYTKVCDITDTAAINQWRIEDPKCSTYSWYNVLMYFCAARAHKMNYHHLIRKPELITCACCNQRFVEDAIQVSVALHLGINRLDVCMSCIGIKFLQQSGNDDASDEQIKDYLRDLHHALQAVPTQAFGETLSSLTYMSTVERVNVLRVMDSKPTVKRVREVYGSWLNALVQSGVLPNGVRKMPRGIQCLAKDGHVCNSIGEKVIDDFLTSKHIPHEKEPHYPEGQYRADFLINGYFIEYFGLAGDPDYDSKTGLKLELCRKHGIKLIALYSDDLWSSETLEKKIIPANN